jgi:cobalt-zinc-cadmium resistance protein CzcA
MPNFDVVKIGDVADVSDGKELRHGAATHNGREAVVGTIMMMTGENSRKVAELAEKRVAEISRDLPAGVEIIPVYSRRDLVNATIETVWRNIISGSILVIIMLFLLVGNLRAAFITALTIPLALVITIIGMKTLNISGNLMSLGALDFGIIIDGVVIVVDHCMRKLAGKKGNPDEIVIEATTEIRKAAGFGQLILLVVFLPIFALVGIEAKTFRPMAATFIMALMAALILSLTLAPALIALLLKHGANEKESRVMMFLESKYRKIMDFVIWQSKNIIFAAAAVIVVGLLLFTRLGAEFIPQLKEGAMAFHLIRPQNTSLTMSLDLQEKAEKIILGFPEIERVFSRIGTAEVASDPMGVNVSDTYIMLKDFGKGVDFDKLTDDLLARLKSEMPGITYLASQPIQMRFNELLEGSRADLTIKIFGPDLNELSKIGEEVEKIVKPISPESDVELDRMGDFPVFAIEPDMRELQRYGISRAAVLEQAAMALSGAEVGYFFDNDRRFPILVRLSDKHRADLEVIKNLPIPTFSDATVPLSSVAKIGFSDAYASINRDNGSRRATIMANIRGMDTGTFVERAQAAVAEKIKLPDGYFMEWGGQYKNLQAAGSRFAALIPLTLAIVFFMIYTAFGSVLQTSLIFMGIPFALCGGIAGLYFAGLPFSISAAVGFIALMGIAVLNSIILINGFNSMKGNAKDRVVGGSVSRLRAIMMTATTDILGFIPMAISTGIGAEVQRPLAVVIIGGIATSTLLTLVVLPAVYYRIYKGKATR